MKPRFGDTSQDITRVFKHESLQQKPRSFPPCAALQSSCKAVPVKLRCWKVPMFADFYPPSRTRPWAQARPSGVNQGARVRLRQQRVCVRFPQLIKPSTSCWATDEDAPLLPFFIRPTFTTWSALSWLGDIFHSHSWLYVVGSHCYFIRQHCCNTITCAGANSGGENDCTD